MQETFNILFIDDEENVLKALKRLFIDEGFEVFTALSGNEGLEILKNGEFAVIVSDQRMPEMTGTEFLQHAKKLCPDTIRIMLTGYADINASINAINQAGAFRYITKPWNDEEVILIIKEAVGRYKLVKENKYLFALSEKQKEELQTYSKELEYYVQIHTIDLTNRDKEIKALKEKLQKNLKEVSSALSALIELRDKNIHSHSKNIAIIAVEIAKKIPLPSSDVETIKTASLLHDIGKIVFPDIMLVKEVGELSQTEMNLYMRHSDTGHMIANMIEGMQKTAELIRHHHEQFNGGGFPDKLKEDNIPIGSRIIAIADRFERLAKSMSAQDSLKKIKSQLGREFDPELYNFLELVAHEQASALFSSDDIVEAELSIKSLAPGLIVSRDVIGGSGMVLLKKNSVLTDKNIELLQKAFNMDSTKGNIFVYKKRK